ncbi:hypothetical protein FACS189496_5090 [Bacilli bacterium]|nr:hypothetical protein FACS189496_5090 [Bacilli bacterium]
MTITFGEATTVIGLDIDSFTIIDEEGAGFNVNITSVEDTSGGYGQSYKLNIDGT